MKYFRFQKFGLLYSRAGAEEPKKKYAVPEQNRF
jgi:hypothetical protein